MKTYSVILLIAAALALGSCGTAYQASQTPDAVYYSPEEDQQPVQTTSSNSDQYVANTDSEEGNYVVYEDGDNYDNYNDDYYDGYSDGYYSRRINMFDRPGGLFSYNYYMMNSPWYGSSYLWNSFAYNSFGWYSNPYMWSPGFRLGLSWGAPYAYGGWYNHWYNPYYSYYNPYYYGGYGYWPGYYGGGKYLIANPRPAVSYGPRRAVGSRAAHSVNRTGVSRSENTRAPRRVFTNRSSETVQEGQDTHTRRTFRPEEGERTVQNNNRSRTRTSSRSERRVFKPRSDERPVRVNRNTNSRTTRRTSTQTQRPTRRVSQPRNTQRQSTRRSYQPTRTYSAPSRSTRPSSPRISSPRRR